MPLSQHPAAASVRATSNSSSSAGRRSAGASATSSSRSSEKSCVTRDTSGGSATSPARNCPRVGAWAGAAVKAPGQAGWLAPAAAAPRFWLSWSDVGWSGCSGMAPD